MPEPQPIKDIIAPPEIVIQSNQLQVGKKLVRTLFFFTYPRYLAAGWFLPIINAPELMDVAIYLHPIDTATALKNLRRKAAHIEAQVIEQEEKGLVRSPMLETALRDVESLRDTLQQATEHLFNVAVYISFYADTAEELDKVEARVTNLLESKLVVVKNALFQEKEAWQSVLPLANDQLLIHHPMNSGPASTLFPFVSADLTGADGILYGINRHNNTLIIFDRFSLENANMVIFAKSGAGKSYATKLEALRQLMFGVDILIIDPEDEYQSLAEAVAGSYFKISLASQHHINPFDIPVLPEGEDPGDILKSHLVTLAGLIKIMVGKVKPEEEGILDRALIETYALQDIVPGKDFSRKEAPRLSQLQSVLENMEGGKSLSQRLYRFTEGTYAGFTNLPTNVDLKNRFIVFSIRDLENELRPIAMYLITHYIWNIIKAQQKKRILIIDEAWWLMQYPDGAAFLFGLVKRARKYLLGVTTITQDVEDFLLSAYGRPIITNSSLQLLLKHSPAMMDVVAKTFNLTEGERNFLLETAVGQGLFFAGLQHAVIQVLASPLENQIITKKQTSP